MDPNGLAVKGCDAHMCFLSIKCSGVVVPEVLSHTHTHAHKT